MKKLIKRLNQSLPYIILTIIALNFVWPMLWMFFASFDANAPMNIEWPSQWTMDNYQAVLGNPMNTRAFGNGLIISLSHATGVLVLSILTAYPLSRYPLRFKSSIMYSMLFLTGLPLTALMIPVYMVFFRLQMVDSLTSTTLFMIATGLPYSIWMMKNFFDDVPEVLEEAARIDGAGTVQILWRIFIPVILPGILVVFIFNFAGSWGNFFVPFVLINSIEKLPASVTIFQFFGAHGRVAYGQLAAYALIYTIPVMFLYAMAQKFMSEGFSLGGSIK